MFVFVCLGRSSHTAVVVVTAAVHLRLHHGAVSVQLLAGVVGDLQEAAGLHHHVGLAGVRQDGELRDHLREAAAHRGSC